MQQASFGVYARGCNIATSLSSLSNPDRHNAICASYCTTQFIRYAYYLAVWLPGPFSQCFDRMPWNSGQYLTARWKNNSHTSFESAIASPSRTDMPEASYPRRQGFFKNESLSFSSLGKLKTFPRHRSSSFCMPKGTPCPLAWKKPYCAQACLTSFITFSFSSIEVGLRYPLRSIIGRTMCFSDMVNKKCVH